MQFEYQFYYKRNLPHIQPKNSIIFITYRLAFSLPKSILAELMTQRKRFDQKLNRIPRGESRRFKERCNKVMFQMIDRFLDNYGEEPQWLKHRKIASLILDSLMFNHERKYCLKCALIMPNHVHLLLKPLPRQGENYYSLAKIMQSHKGYTAREANKVVGRKGQFWQHESYDHFVRDLDEYDRITEYILNNPVNAGFVEDYRDWPYYWPEL